MKRSEINQLISDASICFARHGWSLPPEPRWDVTDFGLGDWRRHGLLLVNLAEEPEYCEKLMYAKRSMTTPGHYHRIKKEDIICRAGSLAIEVASPAQAGRAKIKLNGIEKSIEGIETITQKQGSRITIVPGVVHSFWPESDECIIGEVSTENDDQNDNFFIDSRVGRFPAIDEDEPPSVRLVSDL